MVEIELFKNQQLIPLKEDENGDVLISARDLHEFLEIGAHFKDWFPRMCEYGFNENQDYTPLIFEHPLNKQPTKDFIMKLDMAKEVAMLQRNEKGKQARQYFISVEKAWNSPEMIMKRALEIANRKIALLKISNDDYSRKLEEIKPKVLFAEAVEASEDTILIRDFAKILSQSGVDIGEKRLFKWLRDNGYLIKSPGNDYNSPTQRAMDLKLFRIKETVITHADGHTHISKTAKLTGKGQSYFANKFLMMLRPAEAIWYMKEGQK